MHETHVGPARARRRPADRARGDGLRNILRGRHDLRHGRFSLSEPIIGRTRGLGETQSWRAWVHVALRRGCRDGGRRAKVRMCCDRGADRAVEHDGAMGPAGPGTERDCGCGQRRQRRARSDAVGPAALTAPRSFISQKHRDCLGRACLCSAGRQSTQIQLSSCSRMENVRSCNLAMRRAWRRAIPNCSSPSSLGALFPERYDS